MTAAIRFERVCKTYRRGHAPSFREDTVRMFQRALRRQDAPPTVAALSDVSFEVEQGTSLALMGANGSGKTTALKLVSRVTYPSAGAVTVRGRVGALIEVGTGLHPELTGRENVWLYGRILGLRRADIARHFEDIVDFADIGSALDQPVKQYSSGMQLRLGFSLAAHLEPDVLVVDEAVSVGDAGYQRRCVQRMADLHRSGATLLFVTHMPALAGRLCAKGALLRSGRLAFIGPVEDVIAQYESEVGEGRSAAIDAAQPLRLAGWDHEFVPGAGRFLGDLEVRLRVVADDAVVEPRFGVAIMHPRAGTLVAASMLVDDVSAGTLTGETVITCRFPDLPLDAGEYDVWANAVDGPQRRYLMGPRLLGSVRLGEPSRFSAVAAQIGVPEAALPLVHTPHQWNVQAGEASVPALEGVV